MGVIREALVGRVQPDVAAAVKEAIDVRNGVAVSRFGLKIAPEFCVCCRSRMFPQPSLVDPLWRGHGHGIFYVSP